MRSRTGWMRWGVGKGVALALVAAAFFGNFAWIVMLLWDFVVPSVFHGPEIGYWQALALLVLCRILFGGLRGFRGPQGHWGRHHWRERWESLTPEERARLRERFMERCGRGPGAAAPGGEEGTPS